MRARHGDERARQVVRYEFATNRPIHSNLSAAIAASIQGAERTGDIARQQEQIAEALKDYPYPISELFSRLSLSGAQASLQHAEGSVGTILAAWSPTRKSAYSSCAISSGSRREPEASMTSASTESRFLPSSKSSMRIDSIRRPMPFQPSSGS
jgi:hypothetical protein